VKFVDLEQQQQQMEEEVRKLQLDKASSGFNPYGKDLKKIDSQIEEILMKQKPDGSTIRFSVSNLNPDTMYEFRVRFINAAGKSEFCLPSHRAKTNSASPPGVCGPPVVTDISFDFVQLQITVPSEGGSHIHCFEVEALNLDENSSSTSSTSTHRISRNESDISKIFVCRVSGLTPQCAYMFRCRAESAVGTSASFSDWTAEVQTLAPELGAISESVRAVQNPRPQPATADDVDIKIPPTASKYS